MEKIVIKSLVSFGFPGIALGVFYIILKSFDFKFSEIDATMSGVIVLFLLLIFSFIVIYGLKKFSESEGGNVDSYNVCNIFYAGSDSMKLIKGLESGAELREIINSAYQMIHQMKSSGYAENISYVPILEKKLETFENQDKIRQLTTEESEMLKGLVLNIKRSYSQNMRNIQVDYVSHDPKRGSEWEESRVRNLNPTTPNKSLKQDK